MVFVCVVGLVVRLVVGLAYERVCGVEQGPGSSRVHEPLEEVEEESEAPDEDDIKDPEPRCRDPRRVGVFSRRSCLIHRHKISSRVPKVLPTIIDLEVADKLSSLGRIGLCGKGVCEYT